MENSLAILLSGLMATVLWITVMYAFSWKGIHHGDVLSSAWGDTTNQRRTYLIRSIVICAFTGMIMAPVFYFVLSWFSYSEFINNIGLAAFGGVIQGFVFMHFFVERATLTQVNRTLRRFLLPISFVYWFGHLIYGVAFGSMFASYRFYRWQGLIIATVLSSILVATLLFMAFRNDARESNPRHKPRPKSSH